jgi:hypothetical protein
MKVCLLDPRIFLDLKDERPYLCYSRILECARNASVKKHTLTDSPTEADLIILALGTTAFGPHFERVRRHKLFRQIEKKLVAYSTNANQLPTIRGLYPSAAKKWLERDWAYPLHYFSCHVTKLKIEEAEIQKKDILCSFVGSAKNHPVRERIQDAPQVEGFYLFDSSARREDGAWWLEKNKEELEHHFRDVLLRSQFVLCPRGVSAASVRLFEAMEAAAVPVVISDDLQMPAGPDWNSFCLFIKESEVSSIPDAINAWRSTARERGLAARAAWKEFFCEETSFNYLVDSAYRLLQKKKSRPWALLFDEFFQSEHLRAKIRFLRSPYVPE